MPRPARVLFPAVTVGALAHLVVSWMRARGEAAQHRWGLHGLDWLTWERFGLQPLGNQALIAVGVAGLVALLVEARAGEKSPLRGLFGLLANPAVLLLALGAAWFLPGMVASNTRPLPRTGSPNLLFVMVDTWRADHAGFLGYDRDVTPRLDVLTESGVVFERAISQAPWTKPAVGTLFTGTVPSAHGAVSNPIGGEAVRGVSLERGQTTFLEVLRARGWETAAWSSNPNVIPARGFAQGTGAFFDAFNDPRKPELDHDPGRGEYQIASLRSWLDEHAGGDRPFAAYLHVMDPHYPYEAPPPYQGTFDQSGLDFNLTGPVCDEYYTGEKDVADVTPEMLQRILDIYDEEILYTDAHVGALIEDVLRDHPDTVVVLVSDHGEEFLEHGQFGHGIGLWDTLVHVPLVLWAPTLDPARVPTQVPLMDVPRTVLELMGQGDRIPSSFSGTSLLPVIRGAETDHRLAPMESGGDGRPSWQWRGISDGSNKVVVRERDLPDWPAPALHEWDRDLTDPVHFVFDLETDPGETAGPVAADDERVVDLLETMRSANWYVSPVDLMSGMRARRVDLGGNRDQLADLGYISREEADAADE